MPTISQYETEDGVVPFQDWFRSLSAKAALKVRAALARMELDNFGDHNSVGSGVWERRIHFEKGYRIYYAKDGDELVVLYWGGTKARQQSDIEKAKQYWSEYRDRKKKTEGKLEVKPKSRGSKRRQ